MTPNESCRRRRWCWCWWRQEQRVLSLDCTRWGPSEQSTSASHRWKRRVVFSWSQPEGREDGMWSWYTAFGYSSWPVFCFRIILEFTFVASHTSDYLDVPPQKINSIRTDEKTMKFPLFLAFRRCFNEHETINYIKEIDRHRTHINCGHIVFRFFSKSSFYLRVPPPPHSWQCLQCSRSSNMKIFCAEKKEWTVKPISAACLHHFMFLPPHAKSL